MPVNLLCAKQVFKLFETRKRAEAEGFARHIDVLEHVVQLPRAPASVPGAAKSGQMLADFVK